VTQSGTYRFISQLAIKYSERLLQCFNSFPDLCCRIERR